MLNNPRRAHELIENSIVCDTFVPWTRYGSPALRASTLPRYRRSGFDMVGLSLSSDAESATELLHAIARVRREVRDDDALVLVETVDDVRDAHRRGKLAVSLNAQGGFNLDGVTWDWGLTLCTTPKACTATCRA